jgi:drug/metabolite transporter (DMT)-like permease
LGLCGFVVLIPAGAVLWALMGGAARPDAGALGLVAMGTAVGIAAYTALTGAMRTGDVSVVTPFRYSRLIFGVALGVVAFGEQLDTATLAGSAVVLAAGLYTLVRTRSTGQNA